MGSERILVGLSSHMKIPKLTGSRGVGFLNYWTLSNLPLFLLAVPMLYILCVSSNWAWVHTAHSLNSNQENIQNSNAKERGGIKQIMRSHFERNHEIPWRLAIPQIALAILGLTTYHVQIITRLSSGYPVWYWWLAYMIIEDSRELVILQSSVRLGPLITRWMVMYAVIQGGLFASFLPPA